MSNVYVKVQARSKIILHMRSFLCHQNSRQKQRGYKDGLQPESLADGNWLVKQNQPVSKIWHKLEESVWVLIQECIDLKIGKSKGQSWLPWCSFWNACGATMHARNVWPVCQLGPCAHAAHQHARLEWSIKKGCTWDVHHRHELGDTIVMITVVVLDYEICAAAQRLPGKKL